MEYSPEYYERNPEMRMFHMCEQVREIVYKVRQKISVVVLAVALATPSNIIADGQKELPSSTPHNFPSCSAVRLNYSQTNPSGGIARAYICNPVMNYGTVPVKDTILNEIET